jgi:DNA-binding GntR family transcriptional regulator
MTRNRQPVEPSDPYDRQPGYLYLRVAEHIEARIRTGDLRPGTRLPGERDLAEKYGVSLSTLRRAITVLRERGRVVVLPAKGTYITTSALN